MWRRVGSLLTGDTDDTPPQPRRCMQDLLCGCFFRTRTVTRLGGATNCVLDLHSYDSAQTGYFHKINLTVTGRKWQRKISGVWTDAKSCSDGTTVINRTGTVATGSAEVCTSSTTYMAACDAPAICGNPGEECRYLENAGTYAGENAATVGEVLAAADAAAHETTAGWSSWEACDIHSPPIYNINVASTDSRSVGSASFSSTRMEVQFRGPVLPYKVRYRIAKAANFLAGGGTTYELIEREVSGDWTLELDRVANTTLTVVGTCLYLPG